jgi:hypothetical protein
MNSPLRGSRVVGTADTCTVSEGISVAANARLLPSRSGALRIITFGVESDPGGHSQTSFEVGQ